MDLKFFEGVIQSEVQVEFGNHPVGLKLMELGTGKVIQYQHYLSGRAILSMVSESYPI